jgi:hypothetical protein
LSDPIFILLFETMSSAASMEPKGLAYVLARVYLTACAEVDHLMTGTGQGAETSCFPRHKVILLLYSRALLEKLVFPMDTTSTKLRLVLWNAPHVVSLSIGRASPRPGDTRRQSGNRSLVQDIYCKKDTVQKRHGARSSNLV